MIKKDLIKFMKGSEKYIAACVILQWIALMFQTLAIIAIGWFIENTLTVGLDKDKLIMAGGVIFVAMIAKFICNIINAKAAHMASYDVKSRLRENIYNKVVSLGVSYRQKASTAEIMQLAVDGVEQLEVYYSKYLPQLFYSILAPVTLFILFSFMSLKTAVVLLICVPLIPISIVAVQKFAKKLLNKYWGIYTNLGDSFLENIQGLTTLKIYKSDQMKSDQMDEEAENFRRITMKVLIMQLNSISVMDLIAYMGAGVGSLVAISEFVSGTLELWQVITIILLAAEFFIPLRLLGSFFHIAMNGMAASDKMLSFLDIPEESEEEKETLMGDGISIKVEKLSFGYSNRKKILKDIDLEINPGEFVSVVGVSGSGKSTIAALICGRYRGFDGSIKINGKANRTLKEEDLMNRIVKVGYNSYIFGGTVRDNLLMGKADANENEMKEILEKVNLWNFLKDENGLDTKIEEQGNNLSGGQRQRLVLARALLKDSDMYIFDEASSNIDVESENTIMEVIKSLGKTKTVLFISHRLDNVVGSDKIYLLKDGEIAEEGTHESLMAKKGAYCHMFTTQRELCAKWEVQA